MVSVSGFRCRPHSNVKIFVECLPLGFVSVFSILGLLVDFNKASDAILHSPLTAAAATEPTMDKLLLGFVFALCINLSSSSSKSSYQSCFFIFFLFLFFFFFSFGVNVLSVHTWYLYLFKLSHRSIFQSLVYTGKYNHSWYFICYHSW